MFELIWNQSSIYFFKIHWKFEFELIWQPDNILVDYTENEGKVTNFSFVIADWGTSGEYDQHFGGTPVYASGNAFFESGNKDMFAFGRITAELYLPESGNINKIRNHTFTLWSYFFKVEKIGSN